MCHCRVIHAGALLVPNLSLLSPHTVFSAGEAVRFSCAVQRGHHVSDFHLFKKGAATPLVTQRVDSSQIQAELTLSDVETFHQGSYSCVYRMKGTSPSQLLSSPPSNYVNITVGESYVTLHITYVYSCVWTEELTRCHWLQLRTQTGGYLKDENVLN